MANVTNKRVAIVTGGSGGIGKAVAEKLAAEDFAVAVHYSGNKAKADDLVNTIVANGDEAISVGGDVAEEAAMTTLFDEVEHAFGGIDVVINTAGIMRLSPVAELDWDIFDQVHRTNTRGAFVIAKIASKRVREGGAVIHFSTSVTRTNFPTYAAYAASKAAVETLTRISSKELRGKNITVNAVAPGPTATPLFLDGKDEETIANIANANPMARLGTPEDIAEVTAFLAGPGRWVNGQVVFANGGMA